MAGRAHHPLKLPDSTQWDRAKVFEVILPRLDTMSLPEALAAGWEGRGLPSPQAVGYWLSDDPQMAEEVRRARERRAAHLVDESLRLADEPPERGSDGRIDPGHVRWTESRIKQRQWVAERLHRDQWGQQVQVDMQLHGAIDIVSVLAEARGRVINGHSQVIDTPPAVLDDASDLFD